MKGTVLTIACVLFLQQNTVLHAAPPIEPCPHDSIQVEDTCKCNHELCSKPPCLYELTISVNETDTPGSCCAIYTCEGCSNDTLIEDKCPCASGAILTPKGQCKCVDPHKSLVKDECVCDPNLCELPQVCGHNYVSVSDPDECCSKTKCIKCPVDSFSTNNNDEAVEDKCVCYPCTEKECGINEKVVIMQQGNGFPGSCCDMYRCEKENSDMCVVGGVVYENGDVWENPDSQMCKCQGGISFCTKQNEEESFRSCHKEGSVYKHNESWMLDSCTNCTCLNGETKCIAHFCEVSEGHLKKPECQPLNCSKACPDGYRLNKRGCKTCKCNYVYKYDDILHKYNITKNQLKDILDEYFAKSNAVSTTTAAVSTTVAAVTNISDDYHQFTTPTTELDGCSRWKVWMWLFIAGSVIAAVTIAICGISWLNRRKKGSYDTNPTRSANYKKMKLTKNAIYNNNNCIGNDNKDKKSIKGGV